MALKNFPRRQYVPSQTPIEAAPSLSEAIGGDVNLWIKRDDLLPGAAGGNKTRKLDFALGDAIAKGFDSIITCGAPQSNHCRLTLSWAVKEKMDCHLVIEERNAGSYDPNGSGNILLFKLMGAASTKVVPGGADMAAEMEAVAKTLRKQGKNPLVLPIGASTAIGSLGYADCAFEILNQSKELGISFDAIVTPSGSGGTQAGIIAGLHKLGLDIPVYGINVGKTRGDQTDIVLPLTEETCALLDCTEKINPNKVICDDRYVGPGYALPSDEMKEAVLLAAGTEALLLDPIYSGKAMAGLIDYVRNGTFAAGDNILFLHTGGSPALYAYSNVFNDCPTKP